MPKTEREQTVDEITFISSRISRLEIAVDGILNRLDKLEGKKDE